MVSVTMKELLEAGVHFGHQTKRWNPKMKEYIFGQRNGIYIIDLQKTIRVFKDALQFIRGVAESGKEVLIVGTKKQAQDIVRELSLKCESSYVNQRWLGGLLTTFSVIRGSVEKLIELDEMKEDGRWERIRSDLLEKKVMDFIVDRADIKEVVMDDKDSGLLVPTSVADDLKAEREAEEIALVE